MPYVYSTLSCSTDYAFYQNNGSKELGVIERKITVKGGANVATKYPNVYTPKGLATKVTDEELAALESHPSFKQHVANGFITIDKKNVEVEKICTSLNAKDTSAPRTPDDPEFNQAPKIINPNLQTKGVRVHSSSQVS